MVDINLTGVWNTCSAAIPHLTRGGRGGGSIVITSSAAGLRGMRNLAAYGATEHAVVGLMRSLALELGPHRIRVNTLLLFLVSNSGRLITGAAVPVDAGSTAG